MARDTVAGPMSAVMSLPPSLNCSNGILNVINIRMMAIPENKRGLRIELFVLI